MSTERAEMRVSGVPVQIVRQDIKNLHLGVYPPNGRVRVAVPLRLSNDAVRLAVIDKLAWIRKQQAKFAAQPRQTAREMVSGESHYYLGRRYRLRVMEHRGAGHVVLRDARFLELRVRRQLDAAGRERVLQRWYREQLRRLIPPLLAKWQRLLGVQATGWGIRRMKTKWGSCSVATGRIWLNLELVKKPVNCLEYLVLHELAHLIARRHDDRFVALLDRHMPHWRRARRALNEAPLAHDRWTY